MDGDRWVGRVSDAVCRVMFAPVILWARNSNARGLLVCVVEGRVFGQVWVCFMALDLCALDLWFLRFFGVACECSSSPLGMGVSMSSLFGIEVCWNSCQGTHGDTGF